MVACSLLPGGYPASRVVVLVGLPHVADYSEVFLYRYRDNIVGVGSITFQCSAMLTSTGGWVHGVVKPIQLQTNGITDF
jgi:hypothetical protein